MLGLPALGIVTVVIVRPLFKLIAQLSFSIDRLYENGALEVPSSSSLLLFHAASSASPFCPRPRRTFEWCENCPDDSSIVQQGPEMGNLVGSSGVYLRAISEAKGVNNLAEIVRTKKSFFSIGQT